jgi:PBSX family phage terminase large subunit
MVEVVSITSKYYPNPTQIEFRELVKKGTDFNYYLAEGERGGGKTSACIDCFIKDLIRWPGNRGFIGRKVFSEFRASTWHTLANWLPQEIIDKHNKTEKEITLINGSIINYGGFSDPEERKRFLGGAYGTIFLDQIEDVDELDFNAIAVTLRWQLPDGKRPIYRIYCTCNPTQSWVKTKWILSPKPNYLRMHFPLEANVVNLPEGYEKLLIEQYEGRPELLQIYRYGNWDAVNLETAVFAPADLDWAFSNAPIKEPIMHKPILACDVARYGDDETVFFFLENGIEIKPKRIMHNRDNVELAQMLNKDKTDYHIELLGLDEIGTGTGVVDTLRRTLGLEKSVKALNGQNKANSSKYYNLRDEMHWTTANLFKEHKIKLLPDPELKRQLLGITYTVKGNYLKIDSKDDLKAKLGNSPDRADAVIMGIYLAHRYARIPAIPQPKKDDFWFNYFYGDNRKKQERALLSVLEKPIPHNRIRGATQIS